MADVTHPRLLPAHPAVHIADEFQRHTIACPYEPVGKVTVDVPVKRGAGGAYEAKIDLRKPLRCPTCQGWFRLGTKVVLTGVPLDQPVGAPIPIRG